MAEYDWFDQRKPNEHEVAAAHWRPLGYLAEFQFSPTMRVTGIKYYFCRRGCGTLVWNPEEHSKNVCTSFNPVAGE